MIDWVANANRKIANGSRKALTLAQFEAFNTIRRNRGLPNLSFGATAKALHRPVASVSSLFLLFMEQFYDEAFKALIVQTQEILQEIIKLLQACEIVGKGWTAKEILQESVHRLWDEDESEDSGTENPECFDTQTEYGF